MSAGQEIGSPIRENRTLLPAPLPPDEAPGTLAAAAGVSTVGLRPPFDTPAAAFSSRLSRHSHLDCRARRRLPSGQLNRAVGSLAMVADQQGRHFINIQLAGRPRDNHSAIAKNGHTVSDLLYLVQKMADV